MFNNLLQWPAIELAAMGGREHAAFTADPHVITLILWLGQDHNTTS
jgi:hypothetical protein